MEKNFGTFRKATFGGFNRKDVISYVERIKNETFEYRCQVEDTIRKLNEKITELEGALAGAEPSSSPAVYESGKVFASGESYTDIKDATEHLKSVADELCSSLGEFIEKLSQRGLCEDSCSKEAILPEAEKEPLSDVESILTSIAFLGEKKVKTAEETENKAQPSDVDGILSALSFLY
ncbi:MAG: hypothetical protein E7544_02015 [Ruminococcaceae bacterium]|nr:hypothetical protein [Oscillospiraceae bacterium]